MELRNRKLIVLSLLALAAAACGGGGGGGGGGSASAYSRGAIQRFGSVVVNGVEWRTQGATLKTPDDSTTSRSLSSETEIRDLLEAGQVVSIRGSLDADGRHGQATEIEFHRSLEGIVSGRSAAGATIGGVKVSFDDSTEFYSSAGGSISYTGISDGQRVSVSGVPDDKGGLRAGAVKIENSTSTEVEVKGYVVAAPSGGAFQLSLTPGGAAVLNVNASGATLPAGLAAGSFVEAKGTAIDNATTPPTLTATFVKLEDDLRGGAQVQAEVEGIVSSGTLASFVVAGTTVTTNASTTYAGLPAGATAAEEFQVGIKVEAEGQLDANGTLVARKVKFKDGARISASVTALGAGGLTMLGKSVVTEQSLAGISVGSFVEVRGYPRPDGTIFAQRVRIQSGGNNRPSLQGVVSAVASPDLTIMGIAVHTGPTTEYRDHTQGQDETPITQTQFFTKAIVGTLVKVDWDAGTTDLSTATAREAELEAEDD